MKRILIVKRDNRVSEFETRIIFFKNKEMMALFFRRLEPYLRKRSGLVTIEKTTEQA